MKRLLAALALLFAVTSFGQSNTFPSFAWRNPLPEGGSLNTVIYGPGFFMTAGVGGRVITSSAAGATWTPVATIPFETVNGVALGAGQYVAVGGSGLIFSSSDGTTWTQRFVGSNGWWNAVTFAGGQFVAVGDNGLIATSSDGIDWTSRTSPTAARWAAVAGTADRYVSVAQNGVIATSADGVTWTQVAPPEGFTHSLNNVGFVNGQFVIVCSNGALLTGTDGTSWTAGSTGSGEWLNAITVKGSTYLATGSSSSVLTSTNLTSWTRTVLPTTSNDVPFLAAAAGGGLFTVVAPGGEIWTSPDGADWTSRGNSGGGYRINDVRHLNGKFIAAGTSQNIYSSADGVAWTRTTASGAGFALNAVTYGAGKYVVVTDTLGMLTSPDAVTWTNQAVGDNVYTSGVAFGGMGGGMFVAVGDNGKVRTSTDGVSWVSESTGGSASLRSVAAFSNFFVAVGDNGAIYTSVAASNGATWIPRSSGVPEGLIKVRVVDGCLFALGYNRTLLASANGTTWFKIPLPNNYADFGYQLTDIARLHDGFYVTNSSGLVLKSTDLNTWTKFAQLAHGENFTALASDGAHVVLGGFGATLMESALPAAGAAPAIAAGPAGKTFFAGGNAILSVVATGTGPLTYQWKKGVADVPGATSAILVLTGAQTTDSGSYTVVVSGPGGSPATSGAATIQVDPFVTPAIASAPVVVQVVGGFATLSVNATGTAPLSYQWYHGQSGDTSNPDVGTTNSSFTISGLSASDRYWVRVSNAGGSVDSPTTAVLALAPRNGFSGNSGLNGVTFGNGVYVAVGWNNVMLSSSTGSSWTVRGGPTGSALKGVAFGGGTFVAVGSSGAIRTSSDGTNWASLSSGNGNNNLNAVCYDGTKFIAVGDNSTVLTSTDGATWAAQPVDTAEINFLSVAFGSGGSVTSGYVAVAGNGAIFSTADAATIWTSRTSNTAQALNGVTFGNGTFVAVGNSPGATGTVRTSTDGVTWATQNPGTGNSFNAVAYGNGQFMAIAGSGYFTSTDGVTWSAFTYYQTNGQASMNALVFANTRWVVAGFGGLLFTSSTGASGSWLLRNGVSPMNHNDVIYANGRFVAAADNGTVISSPDGMSLTSLFAVTGTTQSLRRVTYGKGLYVAVGNNGTILSSPDAFGWTARNSGTTAYSAAAFGAGRFVAAGSNGVSVTSLDGVNWAGGGAIGSAQVNAIEYSATLSRFVAVNNSGGIFTSSDGLTWNPQTSPVASDLRHVLFGNGQFVAVGLNSVVLTSPDGFTWTQRTLGAAGISLSKVAFGDGLFIATHTSGGSQIFTSSDAVTWTGTFPSGGVLNQFNTTSVVYGNGTFVVAGPAGLLGQILAPADTLRISAPPVAQTVASGDSGTFSVTVAGGGTVAYQWYRGFSGDTSTPVGTNSSSFATSVAASYWVRVSANGATVDSGTVSLLNLQLPTINTQPVAAVVSAGQSAGFTVGATGTPTPTLQWQLNGSDLGVTTPVLTVANVQPANTGIYRAIAANSSGSTASKFALLGISSSSKVIGAASEIASNVIHPNGTVYDQVLLTGASATVRADAGQFTRITFIDLNDDIVNVELSGAGSLSIVLDGASGPAVPVKYNQAVPYMKGHAGIVITGANETTNVGVYSVGTANTVNQSIFQAVSYDGVADLAFVAISSANGKFGGAFTTNARFSAAKGLTGIYAPGVQFTGPVFLQDIDAATAATPAIILGFASDIRIAGGDLLQTNGQSVLTSGFATPTFVAGASSHGVSLPAATNLGALAQYAPTITPLPAAISAVAGSQASLAVTATGTGTLAYQWRRNGYAISAAGAPSAATANLIINPANQGHTDDYDVVVTDSTGSTTSSSVRLSVAPQAFPGISKLDPAFNLNLESDSAGQINSVVPYGTTQLLAAGEFIRLDGFDTMRRLARFNKADGALDTSFAVSTNGTINAVVVLPLQSGDTLPKIVIGGNFTMVNGASRQFLARLNGDGSLDNTFNVVAPGQIGVGPSASVNAIVALPVVAPATLPRLLIGGNFNSYNGSASNTFNRLMRLNTDGTPDGDFIAGSTQGVNSTVNGIAIDTGTGAAGRFVVVGNFSALGSGTAQNRVARFLENGTIDTSFVVGAGANQTVNAVAIDASSRVLIGGSFTSYAGGTATRFARLTAIGGLQTDLNASNTVNAICLEDPADSDSDIFIGGSFTSPVNRLARVTTAGVPVAGFNANVNGSVQSIHVQSDGKVVFGGFFGTVGGSPWRLLARVDGDTGALDESAAPHNFRAPGSVHRILPQPNGKLLVAGLFSHLGTTPAQNLLRLNANLTLDVALTAATGPNGAVRAAVLEGSGRTVIGGQFTSYGGTSISRIARLNPDLTLDTSFNPGTGANGDVNAIVALPGGGGYYLGGGFSNYNNANPQRQGVARISSHGTLDSGFAGSTTSFTANALALQADGKLVVGGNFGGTIAGGSRNNILRFNSDGSLDSAMSSTATSSQVRALLALPGDAAEPAGRILVGGDFTNILGSSVNRLARLRASDGAVETLFPSNPTLLGSSVYAMLRQEETAGRVIIWGNYSGINVSGAAQNAWLSRVNADGSFDPSLNVLGVNLSNTLPQPSTLHVLDDGSLLIGTGSVTLSGQERNGLLRLVPATPPAVIALSAEVVRPGETVNLTGTNFTEVTAIRFGGPNGIAATNYTVNSPTSITVTVPASALSGQLIVQSVYGNSTPVQIGVAPDFQLRNPQTTAASLESGAAVGTIGGVKTYVIVSTGGGIFTSVDGVDFVRTFTTPFGLNHVAYADNKFVAVGSSSTLLTSTDGFVWTPRPVVGLNNTLNAVAYDGSKWLIVSSTSNTVVTSPDAINWTLRTSSTGVSGGASFNGLAWGGPGGGQMFVAVANGGAIRTSADGLTWDTQTAAGVSANLRKVTFTNSLFVIGGDSGTLITSANGTTWTVPTITGTNTQNLYAAASSATKMVVGGGSTILTSTDGGGSWTATSLSQGGGRSLVHDGTQFVGGSFTGGISTSSDGVTWTPRNTLTTRNLRDVAYGIGRYVAVVSTSNSTVLTSSDAVTWTPVSVAGAALLNGVAYGNGTFVAAGGSFLTVSNDGGVTWTTRTPSGASTLNSVTYGGGVFVAVGNSGAAYRSLNNGVTWSAVTTNAGSDTLNGVGYGAGMFVAVGANGRVITSSDGGATWSATTSGSNALNCVRYANDQFLIVGASSTVLTSQELTSPGTLAWTAGNLGTGGANLTSVAYGDGYYLAVSSNNSTSYWRATDAAATWTQVSVPSDVFAFSGTPGISYGNGRFIAVANNGWIASTNPAPDAFLIATQPANSNFNSGQSVTLSVGANGTGLSYQWFNGFTGDTSSPVAGQTGSTFITGALSLSTRYWVRVTDGSGATVDSVTATLLGPPTITTQPVAVSVNEGSGFTFSVAAFGAPTLAYQWKKDTVDIPGANAASYMVTGATLDDHAGSYSVVVSNTAGSTPSVAVALTVTPAAPTIAQQGSFGQGTIALTGSNVDLQVNVSGTKPILVQWKKNGVNVGAPVAPDTGGVAHLILLGIQPSEQGPYTAIATNAVGSSPEISVNQAQFVVNHPAFKWRQSFPTPVQIVKVAAFPDGGFGIFGNRGYIADSDDGVYWNQSVSLTTQTMNGYASGNNRHLFWASQFFASAKKDGTDLVKSHLPTFETVNEVVFGQGLFVAVCGLGKIFTSPDGVAWIERTSNTSENLFEATFGNGMFAASTATGQIITSANGMTWSAPHAGPSDNAAFLRHANGKFYLGTATGQLYSSSDTTTWTTLTSGVGTRLGDLAYTTGHYVIVGNAGVVLTSTDGTTWSAGASGVTSNLQAVAYDNGNWVAVGSTSTNSNSSVILRSTSNGATWTKQNGQAATQQLNGVTTDGTNEMIAVGNSGTILRSENGYSWLFPTSGIDSTTLNDVTYFGSAYHAVGASGATRTSIDGGENWTSPASGTGNNLFWVGSLNGQLSAVGATGTLLTHNGTAWGTVATGSGSTAQLNGAAFGAGTYVLVGNGGTILTSSTGAASSYTVTTSGTTSNLSEVAFGGSKFVAVGDQGTILTSANGTTWVSQGFGLPENFTHVAFTSGVFIVSGSTSGVFTSPDGVNWTARLGGTNNTASIRATSPMFEGRVYGVGAAGTILAAAVEPEVENIAVGTPVAGSAATFRADFFEPLLPVTFQWSRGGLPIPGATGRSYTIPQATRADAGVYEITLSTTPATFTVPFPVLFSVAPTAYPGLIAADPSWDPNPLTISTRTFAAVKLPDGKWLVGGESVRWDGQPRTALARLNADLTLDASWTPPLVNGVIYALAVAPDGAVYFGGEFSAVDGHTRPGLARLTTVGGNLVHDLVWRPLDAIPAAPTQVSALAVQDNGQLLVARQSFVSGAIGGTNVLRRLNVDGSHDLSLSVNIVVATGARVSSLIAEPGANPAIALAGTFAQVGAVAGHNALARISNTGVVDANFAANGLIADTGGTNNAVNFLTRLSDGRYLVVGNFTQIGGLPRNRIALLNSTNGNVDTTFLPPSGGNTNGAIHGATLLASGKILALGNFSQYAGTNAAGIVRFDGTSGAIDIQFTVGTGTQINPLPVASNAGRNIHAFTLASDKVALIGTFNQLLGQRRVAVAILDGAVTNPNAADPTKTLMAAPSTLAMRPAFTGAAFAEASGQLTVFGSIDAANGASNLGQLVRINPNGSVDSSFPGGAGFGLNGLSTFGIYRGTRQGDGKYVVTGDFVSYNGTTANRLVRINPNGSIDSSFNAGSGPSNFSITPQALAGGKTLLFGSFGSSFNYNGAALTTNIMRVNADGTRDTTFNPGVGLNGPPSAVIELLGSDDPTGNPLLVAGNFDAYNGGNAPGIVALRGNGSRLSVEDFDPGTGPNGGINGFAHVGEGRVLMYGGFTAFDGTSANRVAIFDFERGIVDTTFNAAAAVDSTVTQAIVQADGKIILVGEFSSGAAIRLMPNGAVDATFALMGATFPGGAAAQRLIMADDGSLYAHNGMVSLNHEAPRALVRFKGAAVAPTIIAQPASGPIQTGVDNILSVRAGGTGPYTYQWRKGGNAIEGETDSVLVIPNATIVDAGTYDVIVTGPGGSSPSAIATLSTTVLIADHPTARRAVAGSKVQFRVAASTTLPAATLTYEWRKNGGTIGGATTSVLTLGNVSGTDAGTYTVIVGDGANTLTSQGAALTILTPDNILWQSFTDASTEQSPARTIHDGNGKVYVPWSVQARAPDMVGGQLIGALARLNEADGTLDPTFKLDRRFRRASHAAVQPDGKVLVAVAAGDCETVIRVSDTGVVDSSFHAPLFVRGIRFITLQPNGKVLVATTDNVSSAAPAAAIGGDAPSVYRLNGTDGTLDGTFTRAVFNVGANLFGPPVVDSSGNIYLAGGFGSVNGTSRINIARLGPTGTLDATYAAPASLPAGFASVQARGVAFQSDGRAVFVGDFRYTGKGTQADSIMAVRFSTAGAFDATFTQPLRSALGLGANLKLRYLLINPDNSILAISNRFLRLNANGSPDGTFVSRALGKEGFWLSRGADGRIYAPDQNSVSGNAIDLSLFGNGIARFAADGTPDAAFQTGGWGRSSFSNAGVVLSDGRVWAAGGFNRYGSTFVPGVAQFNADGTLSATQAASTLVQSYAALTSAGGDQVFTIMNSGGNSTETPASFFVRLNANATVDGTFSPVFPGSYGGLGSTSLAASPGGKVLVYQENITPQAALAGTTGDSLFRMNANGSRDAGFNATLSSFAVVERGAGNAVTMIRTGGVGVGQVLADGRSLVGGAGIDGSFKIVRLLADGSVDSTFNPPSFGTITPSVGFTNDLTDPVTGTTTQFNISTYDGGGLVHTVLQTADGKVYVGGSFLIGGAPRGLVRLNANGTLDSSFTGAGIATTRTDGGPYVEHLAVDSVGRVYVGGRFDSFNGSAVPGLFRLRADGTVDSTAGWLANLNVLDVPAAVVRLVPVGAKLYAFGTVGLPGDALPSAYRVVDIPPAPGIQTPPNNVGLIAGGNATFTVVANGTGPFTYQWFKGASLISGATNASYTINGVGAGDVASYSVVITGPGGTTTTTAVTLSILTPPTIVTQPQSQAASAGEPFTLTVVATGSATLNYQWSKDGTPINGATSASYTVASAIGTGTGSAGFGTAGDGGDYTVHVSNTVGSADSSPAATVVILPPNFKGNHALVGAGYLAGSTVTITNTLNYSGTLSALGWTVLLPPGWAFVSDSGTSGAASPVSGTTEVLDWFWIAPPASGTTFTYTVSVPAGTTGQKTLVALYKPRQSGNQYTLLVKPDPLVIDKVTFHSADTGNASGPGTPDSKISLTELLRVIELYNTRNGTVRTGAYDVAVPITATEDGFIPAPSRTPTEVVTLPRYHSGDTGNGVTLGARDAKLQLTELLRVIELYNYRNGTVRTGEYHVQSGTEDGFAPGPAPL